MHTRNTTRYTLSGWNLSEIAKPPQAKTIKNMQKALVRQGEKFASKYRSAKPSISAARFAEALRDADLLYESSRMVSGFAMLKHSENAQSDSASALLASSERVCAEVENKTLFFELWWQKKIDAKNAKRLLAGTGELKDYMLLLRRLSKYSLSEPEEQVINMLDTTGQSAMIRLYDRITSGFTYSVGGRKNMTREQVSSLVRSPSAATRKAAYKQLLGKYGQNVGTLGEIYQNIVMRWANVGLSMRGHAHPISVRNVGNDIRDETAAVLLQTCKDNRDVFYDYFALKARHVGGKRLSRYDLYAPMGAKKSEKKYPYAKAVRMVLDAMYNFSPEISGWAKSVFDAGHVDSQPRHGKLAGAFCATIKPGILPYVMLSYTQRLSDVFTLAHEMGHAVHAIAASGKPAIVQEASLPLAETASTFSEMLLYESISESITDAEKSALLAEKIADWYATVMRQSYFTIFEEKAHWTIVGGGSTGDVSKLYVSNLHEQFGSALSIPDEFAYEWSCIPHFYHAPFYCYAYSFGNLLALSLFRRYKKEGASFVREYRQILAGGGAKNPEKLLLEHGFDINSGKFWRGGFEYIREQISELEKLR